jgi:hypothetical protein
MVQGRITYYDKCNRFYLSPNDYTEYEPQTVVDVSQMVRVDEPVGWDNVTAVITRDLETHGVATSFTDGEQELQFECKAGRTLLRDAYLTFGTDAQVKFLFGDYDEDAEEFTVQFSADVNFNSFKYNDLFSVANVELRDFASIVRSRFEVDKSLDLDEPEAIEVGLASKVIPELIKLNHTGFGLFERAVDGQRAVFYYMPQYTEGANSKFGELTIPNYSGTFIGEPPTNLKRYLFQVERAGQYSILVDTCIELNGVSSSSIVVPNVTLRAAVFSGTTNTFIGAASRVFPTSTETVDVEIAPSVSVQVARRYFFEGITSADLGLPQVFFEGDEVYVWFQIASQTLTPIAIGEPVRIPSLPNRAERLRYEIIAKSAFPSSFVKGLKIKDAANQVLTQLLSDIPAYSGTTVESDFLDSCDTLILTSGSAIRAADVTNSLDITPTVSMKQIMDTLSTVYNCGFSFEFDSGEKVMRIEPASNYYRDEEIIELTDPYDYEESVYIDTTYNEVEVGYATFTKQRDDSSSFKDGSLDDVHAQSTFLTPIKTNKAKYSKISPIIFSGFEIESQRRIQFDEKEIENAKSYKNDDAIFAISVFNADSSQPIDVISRGTNQFTVVGIIKPFIKVGDSIRLRTTDGVSIASPVTVSSIEYRGLTTDIVYTGTDLGLPTQLQNVNSGFLRVIIVNESGTNRVQEGNEALVFVDGIGFPDDFVGFLTSEYNLRFTPKRILLSHANIINNCLLEKSSNDQIVLTASEGNTEATTQLDAFFDCSNGDVNYLFLKENDPIKLSDFNNNEALFRNRLLTFKHRIDWDEFNKIRRSMINLDGSSDYGYISVVDLDGEVRKGFLLSVDFNVAENDATFNLLEVATPTEPPVLLNRLNVSIRETTSSLACGRLEPTQTFFTADNVIGVGTVLSIDSLLIGTVVGGFYKWFLPTGNKVIEVVNSEIVSIDDCLELFQVSIGRTTFANSNNACGFNDDNRTVFSTDAVVVAGSFLYLDSAANDVVLGGFYRLSGGRVMEVGSGGEVLSITTCPQVFTHFIGTLSTGFAQACSNVGSISAFSLDATIGVGSVIFSDGSLSNFLPDGYYSLIETGETVFIDGDGEVTDVRDCGDFEEATIYWGGANTSTPNATDIQNLMFSRLEGAPADGGNFQLDFPDIQSGEWVVVSFPDVWFNLVDITDITGQYSWFQDWERASDVVIGGETYRVYITVEQVANLTYSFRFFFED